MRVSNDADVQGFGGIFRTGRKLVVTLGTGVGTFPLVDGRLRANLEIGRDKLRDAPLQRGEKKWEQRLEKFINPLDKISFYQNLYGGGNSRV